jgi:hypothetical protein
MLMVRDDGPARARDIGPAAQPRDHVGPHAAAQHEARRRAATLVCACDVARVGVGDRRERGVVGESVGERVEEAVDRRVLDGAEQQRRVHRSGHRGARGLACRGRDVEELTRLLVDEERVAGGERVGERRRYRHDAVAAEDDRLPRREPLEQRRERGVRPGGAHGGEGWVPDPWAHGRAHPAGRHPRTAPGQRTLGKEGPGWRPPRCASAPSHAAPAWR